MESIVLREATGAARDLTAGPRYSAPRLLVDLLAIVGLAWLSETVGNPVLTGLVVVFIGAAPLHDVLVHGHEAMHGNASRNPWVNAFILWFTHALVGISGRAHRSFHFDHHRFVGSDRDPEHRIHGTVDGRTTWMGAFRVVALAHVFVNGHRWRGAMTRVEPMHIALELLGAVLLHAGLIALFGPWNWLVYGVLAASTGLPMVAGLRAAAEHLAPRPTDVVHTRAYRALRVGQWAWSNVDHHVEHHLCPQVPYHRLPELRRRLLPVYAEHGVSIDVTLFRTAMRVSYDALL